MTTEYVVKKIQSFGFARNLEAFNERFTRDNQVYILSSRQMEFPNESFIGLQSIDELGSVEKDGSVIVIDLECDIFNDIKISMPKIQKAGESSKEQQVTKEEMQEDMDMHSLRDYAYTWNDIVNFTPTTTESLNDYYSYSANVCYSLRIKDDID